MLRKMALPLAIILALGRPAQGEVIGVSLSEGHAALLEGMQRFASQLDGVKLRVMQAPQGSGQQVRQLRDLVAMGIDAVITDTADERMMAIAAEAGIPIVLAQNPPSGRDPLPSQAAFVGFDQANAGRLQAREVCRRLSGRGSVLVLSGPKDDQTATLRTRAVQDSLATDECDGIAILDQEVASGGRREAAEAMGTWLKAGRDFDGVIAVNDDMAIGAIQAMKSAGRNMTQVVVAGCGAGPDALKAIESGDLDVTIFQDPSVQGWATVDAALKLARGEYVDQTYRLPWAELVTPESIDEYRLRGERWMGRR